MKGPTLVYDLRVLRVFRCSACGREVPMPGSTTSQLCTCSDPPRFMTAVDRPKTPIPDTTAFQSPADPAEAEEPEEEISEENYVPFIPQIPVRPPQFPQRRKLSEDIQKFEFRENGDQLEVQPLTPPGSEQPRTSEDRDGGHRGHSRRGHSNRSDSRSNSDGQPRGRHDGPRRQRDDWRKGRDNTSESSDASATDGNAATPPAEPQSGHRDRDRDRSSHRDRNRDRRSRQTHSGQDSNGAITQDSASDGAQAGSLNESSANQTESPRHGRGDRNRPPRRPVPASESSGPSQEFGDGVNDELLNGSLPEDGLESDEGTDADESESANGETATGSERGRRRPRRRGRRRGRGRGPAGNEAPPAAE